MHYQDNKLLELIIFLTRALMFHILALLWNSQMQMFDFPLLQALFLWSSLEIVSDSTIIIEFLLLQLSFTLHEAPIHLPCWSSLSPSAYSSLGWRVDACQIILPVNGSYPYYLQPIWHVSWANVTELCKEFVSSCICC